MFPLEAISPIDGRYRKQTEPLSHIFSELGLIKYRLKVESEYFLFLSQHPQIDTRKFSNEEIDLIHTLSDISGKDAQIVKDIEVRGYGNIKPTNHDVKAIEYFMKQKLTGTSLEDSLEWIHFALTSEDVNNLAYGLMLSDALEKIIVPSATNVYTQIDALAQKYSSFPMLARTHGQSASPTTFGKEFKVFSSRLSRQLDQLNLYTPLVKLNGATGNYNAHHIAYPQIDWIAFTNHFIETFNTNRQIKLKPNLITTQIEPHDTYAELFDNIRRLNTILIDFNQDMWRYISDDWISQNPVEGEVGSSTMPHKVNPIDFENSEGNLSLANTLLQYFSTKLPISRLQRDLSDSTVERNFGVALAHSLLGYNSTSKGLSKITLNEQKIITTLENHPEIISEAIQTILRREGIGIPYEQLKQLTRGKKITTNDFNVFIENLNITSKIKEELKNISPTNYTGIASLLVKL